VVLAHADLMAAQEEHVRATEDLAAARLAEERAARAQVTVRESIVVHRRTLGQLARSAYQANGPLGEWALVLASQTPEQLVDRLAMVQSVTNAGNAMIGHLREEGADLRTYSGRLRAARAQQEFLTAAAAAALQRSARADAAALAAEQQLEAVLVVHKAALAAALHAEAADRVRYQVFSAQSGQLAIRIRSLAAALAATKHPARGTGSFDRPGTGPVTSPFGPRLHPILHYVKLHTGEDFGKGDGIVYAADDGVVLITELNTAYGNMTVIDHGTIGGLRVTTLYAHQAAFGVHPGDRVRKGQPIGVIGATGYATGPHLHFEVRIDGSPLDPAPFLVRAPLPPGVRL
jgi:murein DD-endopeptidase MepM/ murein hydrolase activator NlpD